MAEVTTRVSPLRWRDTLELLDQRALPLARRWVPVADSKAAARLIRDLAVRGAPAIGLAAAYAMAVETRRDPGLSHLRRAGRALAAARPTATNLAYAVGRVLAAVEQVAPGERFAVALDTARTQHAADAAACLRMGEHGAELLQGTGLTILTHCNAGALATGGIGSALGVVRVLHAQGRLERLLARETRPVLQGSRLTAWEAMQDHIPVTLIVDGAAGSLLARGIVDGVVVGADRIAADGSVANKVGTYPLAVLAARHHVPFVVAAPVTTFDLACPSGDAIPIEERGADEVRCFGGVAAAPRTVPVLNPAFDVTPGELIHAIVSERGVARPVEEATVRRIGS